MDLDKNIENFLLDEERKYNLEPNKSQSVWEGIEKKVNVKRKWYERLLIKINGKSKYAVDFAAIALASLIIFLVPVIILNYKASHGNIPSSNKNSNIIKKNNTNNTDDKQISNSDENQPPQSIYDEVEKGAKSQFQRYTIYYNGMVNNEIHPTKEQTQPYSDLENKKYYIFTVFESRTDSKLPKQIVYYLNAQDGKILSKEDLEFNYWNLLAEKVICKIEGYEQNALSQTEDINIFEHIDKTNNSIIDYRYDPSTMKILEIDRNTGKESEIYTINPEAYSILTVEKKLDLNGDGNTEDIKIDYGRGILTINGVSISNYSICSGCTGYDFAKLKSTDIELYTISSGNDEKYHRYQFYGYKNGLIYLNGDTTGTGVVAKGDGKITVKNHIESILEAWVCDIELKPDTNGRLTEILTKDFYRIPANMDQNEAQAGSEYQKVKLKTSLTLYKDKNSTEVTAKLKAGDILYIIGTDKNAWVLAKDANGVQGWFELEGDDYSVIFVKEARAYSEDVFDGLNFTN